VTNCQVSHAGRLFERNNVWVPTQAPNKNAGRGSERTQPKERFAQALFDFTCRMFVSIGVFYTRTSLAQIVVQKYKVLRVEQYQADIS
jgi:hypothetical protein